MTKKTEVCMMVGLVFILFSCEKTLDIDLNESDPKLVIEANLVEGENPFRVKVSKTANYFDSSDPDYVNDAEVILSFENGTSVPVPFKEDGEYETMILAMAESSYTLTVIIDDITYRATSYLPKKVQIEELETEYVSSTPAFDEGYNVFVRFNDPPESQNYYRFLHTSDDEVGDDILVVDDNLFDGGLTRIRLFGQVFEPRAEVTIELIHFDEASYEYFNSLADIIGNGNGPNAATAAPGNPISNWSGGVLGYFSAYSSHLSTIIIPDTED